MPVCVCVWEREREYMSSFMFECLQLRINIQRHLVARDATGKGKVQALPLLVHSGRKKVFQLSGELKSLAAKSRDLKILS